MAENLGVSIPMLYRWVPAGKKLPVFSVNFRANARDALYGKKGGRPRSLDFDKRALAVKLYDEKRHTVDQICKMMGISKPTLYKYIEAEREILSKP